MIRSFSRAGAALALSAWVLLPGCGGGGSADTQAPVVNTPAPVVSNRAPVAANASVTTSEDVELTGMLPAATDADGDAVTYSSYAWPEHGSLQVGSSGSFSYRPYTNFFGSDRFSYQVYDGRGGQSIYTVSVTVVSVDNETPDPDCENLGATPAPTGTKKIAFVTPRDGNHEIYAVNDDGTGLSRLTNDPARDEQPAWSPDGTRIAFVSDRTGSPEIYLMTADGSRVVRRTFSGGSGNPTWSPDGTRIAYVSNTGISVVGAECGSPPGPLFSVPGYIAQPAWSPDGTRIALVSDWAAYDFVYDLYVINTDGTGFTPLTGNIFDHVDYLSPSWSPDGTRIATAITQTVGIDQYVTTLGIVNADGTGLTPLIAAATWTTSSWSPDGTRIAFTSVSAEVRNVSWIAADGSASGTIVTDGWSPSWQP